MLDSVKRCAFFILRMLSSGKMFVIDTVFSNLKTTQYQIQTYKRIFISKTLQTNHKTIKEAGMNHFQKY